MKVTPLDIRRKEFKRSMRGYSDEEVDLFLDEVADEFERLFQENIELQERIQRLEEQMAAHAQLREALEKTLITAQVQADEIKANARKESELILRDAELKARDIVGESYKETQRVQQALIQLKRLEEDFRFKFRSLLEGHLKLLEEAPIVVSGRGSQQAEESSRAGTSDYPESGGEPAVPTTSIVAPAPDGFAAPVASAASAPAGRAEVGGAPSGPMREAGTGRPGRVMGRPLASDSSAPVSPAMATAASGGEQPAEPASDEAEGDKAQASERAVLFGRKAGALENGFFAPEPAKNKDRDFEW